MATKELGYSLGRKRVISNQTRSATRLKALETKNKEVNAEASPPGQPKKTKRLDKSHHSIHIPEPEVNIQERRTGEDGMPHESTDKLEEVPPKDSSLFYSNGNPKPSHARQQPARVLTIYRSQCQGRRGKGRRARRFHGGPSGNLGEPSFSFGRHSSPSTTKETDLKNPSAERRNKP